MWIRWWNPQDGSRKERLRAWRREYWQKGLIPDGIGGQGIKPRTKEEKYRCNIRSMRQTTIGILVIYAIGVVGTLGQYL